MKICARDIERGQASIFDGQERFRLQGVKDEDFNKIAGNQSKSSLNHLSGDSICVDVLMAIFKQML